MPKIVRNKEGSSHQEREALTIKKEDKVMANLLDFKKALENAARPAGYKSSLTYKGETKLIDVDLWSIKQSDIADALMDKGVKGQFLAKIAAKVAFNYAAKNG